MLLACLIAYPRLISKSISVRIDIRGDVVLQIDPRDSDFSQSVQFARLAYTVMIRVDPQSKTIKDGVSRIDEAIAVPAT